MRTTCKRCGMTYDDTLRWAICPHRFLNEPADVNAEKQAAAGVSNARPAGVPEGGQPERSSGD